MTGKKKSVNREKYTDFLIHAYMKQRFSANEIQRRLHNQGYGMQRKRLLVRIRNLRGQGLKSNNAKYIPIKFRKKQDFIIPIIPSTVKFQDEKGKLMFRSSFAINGVPWHSHARKPNYLNFLIQGFSTNRNILIGKHQGLKRKLVNLANEFLGYNYNALVDWDCGYSLDVLGKENCVEIPLSDRIVNKWLFECEKNGAIQHEKEGSLNEI